MLQPTVRRRPNLPGRALASLLLVLLVYGSTVEIVHHHGDALSPTVASADAFNNTDSSGLNNRQQSSYGDCLICQLHQHLSNGLFQARTFILNPLTTTAASPATEVRYLSLSDTPQRGRAPPRSALL